MIEELDDKEYPRFRRILKSMNATTDLVRKLMGEPDTGRGLPLDVKFHKESPLHAKGYKVGKSGQPAFRRHEILRQAFIGDIPPTGSATYMAEWGEPSSGARLQRIANTIASLCRNAKNRNNPSYETAIQHWEADLARLKEEFYDGRFRFPWPNTDV